MLIYICILRINLDNLPVAVNGLVIVPCYGEGHSNGSPEFLSLWVVLQCTPVVLDDAILLLS